jgi:hypothetical protein
LSQENEKKPASPVVPVVGMLALLVARGLGYIPLNDPLIRVLIFLPLFTLFLMRTHRETVYAPGARPPPLTIQHQFQV